MKNLVKDIKNWVQYTLSNHSSWAAGHRKLMISSVTVTPRVGKPVQRSEPMKI